MIAVMSPEDTGWSHIDGKQRFVILIFVVIGVGRDEIYSGGFTVQGESIEGSVAGEGSRHGLGELDDGELTAIGGGHEDLEGAAVSGGDLSEDGGGREGKGAGGVLETEDVDGGMEPGGGKPGEPLALDVGWPWCA